MCSPAFPFQAMRFGAPPGLGLVVVMLLGCGLLFVHLRSYETMSPTLYWLDKVWRENGERHMVFYDSPLPSSRDGGLG